jgi:hypothetical protein
MKVKGSVVSSIQKFVKEQYPSDYNHWLNRLPEPSKEIHKGVIMASEWYPLNEAVVEPTRLIGEMFFNGDVVKAARMSGKQSAQDALTGIYKVFVMVATPKFIIKRSSKIMTSFYTPSKLVVGEERPNGVDIHISEFDEKSEIVEHRIAGWMEKALEICGCRDITIDVSKSQAKGDELTQYVANWE